MIQGPSWCTIRLLSKGDRLPARRVDPLHEDAEMEERMEVTKTIISLDANGLYSWAMKDVYHGLPILRMASNGFVGALQSQGKR